jgi:hypothetical protein
MKLPNGRLTCILIAIIGAGGTPAFGDNSLVLSAGSAWATWGIAGGSYDPFQSGDGGEFAVLAVDADGIAQSWIPADYSSLVLYTFPTDDSGNSGAFNGLTAFETFCVEGGTNDVYFNPGQIYTYSLSEDVLGGSQPDMTLSVGAAWLYEQFATGTLEGYDFSTTDGGRSTTAAELQDAIWFLQGETGDPDNIFSLAAESEFGTTDDTESVLAYGNDFGVEVINLTDGDGAAAQNQLFYDGDPVPDGGKTIGLFGAALIALILLRRRRAALA